MTSNNQNISTETYKAWLNSNNMSQSIPIDPALTAVSEPSTLVFAVNDEGVMKETMKQSSKKKRRDRKHLLLTKDEDIKLLQLCLQNANSYDALKMMTTWWNNIIKEFNKWLTREEVTNLSRHVAKLIKERELQLKMLMTGDEDEKGPYIDAIDEWIIIHKSFEDDNVTKKKTMKKQQMKDKKTQKKRDEWIKTLSQKRRNQKVFNSDHSDDVATSSFRNVATSSLVDVSVVAESVASSSTFKLMKAKRAKIDTTAANTAIIELADEVKIAFQTRTTFIPFFINQEIASLNDRIFKLKDEMKIAKKNRELQNETLAKILEIVQKK